MIKFILQLILVVALSYLSHFILPWWGVLVGSTLATIFVYNKALSSFFAGFIGLGTLWFYMAYQIDIVNQSLLSNKVATLLGLTSGFHLVIVTALLGALIGGISALTGNYFIALFKKEKINRSPYH